MHDSRLCKNQSLPVLVCTCTCPSPYVNTQSYMNTSYMFQFDEQSMILRTKEMHIGHCDKLDRSTTTVDYNMVCM